MSYQQLITLLPCHSLDDFPFHLEGAAADDILSAVTALWHPALIAAARTVPTWRRSDVGEDVSWQDALVMLPQVCRDDMPGYFVDELQSAGATVIDCGEMGDEPALIASALEGVETNGEEVPPEVVDDFLALGLCHLLTEVLTVRMRYSSLLDGDRFSKLLLAAADAALSGDPVEIRDGLSRCFDALAEAKDHFYPVDTFLFDLTLVAPSTSAADLAAELAHPVPTNLMIAAEDLLRLTEGEPSLKDAMRNAIAENRLCLLGSTSQEQTPISIFSTEQLFSELSESIGVFERLLGTRPTVFGRRTFALHPQLPQLLAKLGYVGALHQSLDGTRCPESYHGAIAWQGFDGTELTALARMPLSAADPESILRLPRELSEAMDHDHVAAIGLAHYPGYASRWYRRLQRITDFASVLGKFVPLDECLGDAQLMTGPTHFDADDYRTPYLRLAAATGAEPVSPVVDRFGRDAEYRRERGISLLADALASHNDSPHQASALEAVAHSLPGTEGEATAGLLLLNPSTTEQTMVVDVAFDRMPAITGGVQAAAELDGRRQAVVEVPAMGYAWIVGDGNPWQPPAGKPMAEEHLLRNEFFELRFDPITGGLQSLHTDGTRGNLLSERLALRWPTSGIQSSPQYSRMVADTVQGDCQGPFRASQSISGQLLGDDDLPVCRFEQIVSIARGVPLIDFTLQLHPEYEPQGNPWQSYYGVRFAWPGDAVFRGVGSVRQRTFRTRIEAPHFLDLAVGNSTITLLPGGIPYHTQVETGQLDMLLIPPGETARSFSWKLGVDLLAPAESAWMGFVEPATQSLTRSPINPQSAWVLHIGDPKVVVTHAEFIGVDGEKRLRLRLLETGGRRSRTTVRCFRSLGAARKLDFTHAEVASLATESDRVELEMAPGELCLLELEFAR